MMIIGRTDVTSATIHHLALAVPLLLISNMTFLEQTECHVGYMVLRLIIGQEDVAIAQEKPM